MGELKRRERNEEVETPSSWLEEREDLRGQKSQESMGSRPELILREAREGHSFFGGRKPLEHRY